VSQLHARAIRRLRDALGDMNPQKVAEMRRQLIAFAAKKPLMVKASIRPLKANGVITAETVAAPQGVVLPYKVANKRPAHVKATLKMPRQRQAIAAAR
jgi:hypothetical protein